MPVSHEPQTITQCRVVGDHELELCFADGFTGRLVLRDALWGPVFDPLNDPAVFRKARVEDDTVRWPNGADFCPDVLRCWCEAGHVLNQEETDRYYTSHVSVSTAA